MTDIDIRSYANRVHVGDDGVWYAVGGEEISYPESGHADSVELQGDSFWYGHRNEIIHAAVKCWQPGAPFFDIGGGTGVVARYLQEQGYETVLVEPGTEGARIAKRSGLKNVICATAASAELREETIPAIGAFDVIEHIREDAAFVGSLNRLLVPGGMLFATVPAYNWLWSGEDVHAGHFRRYSRSTFEKLLNQCGFRVLYATYFFWMLPIPILIQRTLPSLLFKNHGHDINTVARQHRAGSSLSAKAVRGLLKPELSRVKGATRIPFGSSILAVASRKP